MAQLLKNTERVQFNTTTTVIDNNNNNNNNNYIKCVDLCMHLNLTNLSICIYLSLLGAPRTFFLTFP